MVKTNLAVAKNLYLTKTNHLQKCKCLDVEHFAWQGNGCPPLSQTFKFNKYGVNGSKKNALELIYS